VIEPTPPHLHGPYPTWTRKAKGKTITRRLTEEQYAAYRPWIEAARRKRTLLAKLEALSLEIIEAELHPKTAHTKPRAARPRKTPASRVSSGGNMAAIDTEGTAENRFDANRSPVSWHPPGWSWPPDFFSPLVVFPMCWLFGIALAQIRLLHAQQPWSGTAWLVMLWSPVAFLLGGIVGGHAASLVVKLNPHRRPFAETLRAGAQSRRTQLLLSVLVLLGLAGITYQFASAHDVPLLTSNIDKARTSLPGGPTIVLLDALVIAATLALVLPERLLSRAASPYLAVVALALGALALTGGRGDLVVPPVVAGLARWRLGRRPPPWSLAAVAVLAFGGFSILFYLRIGQEAHNAITTELLGRVVYHMPAPLVPFFPLWLAVATEFNSLARLVAYFPTHHAYGYGAYDAGALHDFVHPASVGTILDQLTPPWNVATFAGPLWADGGFVALTGGAALIGALTTFAYRAAQRSGRIGHLLVSCYMLFLAVFCVYTNYFTGYFDWILVTAGLMLAGLVLEPSDAVRDRGERLWGLVQHATVSARSRGWHNGG
jgi:oligosaccharide repeat unit polymerase